MSTHRRILESVDEAPLKAYRLVEGRELQQRRIIMQEAVLVFLGLLIVAIVNFLGMRQIVRTLQETKGKG